jgi:hypothetical protein
MQLRCTLGLSQLDITYEISGSGFWVPHTGRMANCCPVCYPHNMQITVTIPDELAAQVQSRGLTPEKYVERLIAERTPVALEGSRNRELSAEEFNSSLDALARYSHKIPSLPIEALSRESLYQDHD